MTHNLKLIKPDTDLSTEEITALELLHQKAARLKAGRAVQAEAAARYVQLNAENDRKDHQGSQLAVARLLSGQMPETWFQKLIKRFRGRHAGS